MAFAIDLGTVSAISDYANLVAQIKLWLDRGNELDALVPTFVANAENYMNRILRTPEMEAVVPLTVVDGVAPLPLDCLAVRNVIANSGPLDQLSPAERVIAYGALRGDPAAYSIVGRQITLAPICDQGVTLIYWQRIPAISTQTPSNWVLDSHPDIYLYGALAAANAYIDDPERIARWSAAFEAGVDQISVSANKSRWGGPIIARPNVANVRGGRA